MFILPIVSAKRGKEKTYYHTVEEFMNEQKTSKLSGVNYLKGLGSLSMDDWEWVMNNKKFFKIKSDRSAKRYMDIAFGDSSKKRKKWLQGKTTV
jgi:DNA gyrase/topoisomerase IV subunit B